METNEKIISKLRIKNLRGQGYFAFSDCEISEFSWGNRFASILSGTMLLIGLIMMNTPILIALNIVLLGGVILPYNLFDYIYNHVLCKILNKPKIPPRSKQTKFAILLAFLLLTITIILFYFEYTTIGYVVGGIVLFTNFIVNATDYCVPAEMYNLFIQSKKKINVVPTKDTRH